MRNTFVALAAAALLAGCSGLPPWATFQTDPPAASNTPTPRRCPKLRKTLRDLVIGFGSLGPATIGMRKADALETGMFRAGSTEAVDGCPEPPLLWKEQFVGVDVRTAEDGTITSLGVFREGPTTKAGIGVGSTFAELKKAYGSFLSDPTEAGYLQTGAYVREGDRWIGFLLNPAVAQVQETTPVSFIEVTKGARPDLMRDGC